MCHPTNFPADIKCYKKVIYLFALTICFYQRIILGFDYRLPRTLLFSKPTVQRINRLLYCKFLVNSAQQYRRWQHKLYRIDYLNRLVLYHTCLNSIIIFYDISIIILVATVLSFDTDSNPTG